MRPVSTGLLAFALATAGWAGNPAPAQAPPAAPEPPAAAAADPDLTKIEAIPYKPTQRRDPFSVPSDTERSSRGDLVDDIGVKGRIVTNGKVMLVATDSRGNIRTLPVGFRFRDGEIVAITDRAVTFHQWEINTTNKTVYRTIVKTFTPEEGKP